MKKVLSSLLFILFVPVVLMAQSNKAALSQACQVFREIVSPSSSFHMAYDVTTNGNGTQPGVSVKHNDVYKAPNAYKILIGDDQQIFYTPGRMLVINNGLKFIHYAEDTATTTNAITTTLFSSFLALIDSAKTVDIKTTNNNTVYTLTFGSSYAYETAVFTFNQAGKPTSIYCIFNQHLPVQPFYDMNLVYTAWDNSFAAEAGFPGIDQVITKGAQEYKLVAGREDYKLYQTLR